MPPRLRSAASTTASIGSRAMICAISLPAMEKADAPISTGTSVTTPAQGARTMPRSRSASAWESAASATLNCDSRLTRSSLGKAPVSISLRRASNSARRCATSARACATCATRASSESTAITSSFCTSCPRFTRSSVRMPPVRATAITLRSASVRPDRISLRLCCSFFASMTATRNSFGACSLARTAAWLSGVSCGIR